MTVYPNNAIMHQLFGRYSAVKTITKPRGMKMSIIENSAGKKPGVRLPQVSSEMLVTFINITLSSD